MTIFGVPLQILPGQLALGLVSGSFYAIASLGLAVIFGLLGVVNFAHGCFFMMGAFFTWMIAHYFGISYWFALFICPLAVGCIAWVIERTALRRLYSIDPLYGFLFTLGFALVIRGVFRFIYGVAGQPYSIPSQLTGSLSLGFMHMPYYRLWVLGISLIVCLGTWLTIEKTRLGSVLRAASENSQLTQALGHDVPALRGFVFLIGAGLAGFAGLLAAPIMQVGPTMGDDFIIVVFAVVVIGGMGSIGGAIVSGFLLGMVEALAKIWIPEASATAIFAVMVLVLMIKPEGLFGREGGR